MYVSEFTHFINELHDKKPTLDAEQRRGRAIWWDQQPVTPEVSLKVRESTLHQQAYVYQIKG
jgi:hypothetical protein